MVAEEGTARAVAAGVVVAGVAVAVAEVDVMTLSYDDVDLGPDLVVCRRSA